MIVTDEEFWVTACATLVGLMQAVKHGVSASVAHECDFFFFTFINTVHVCVEPRGKTANPFWPPRFSSS